MICPQCDGILGGGRCQGCGWNTNEPWPAHRLMAGSSFPLKDRALYPPPAAGIKTHIIVADDPARDNPEATPVHEETVNTVLAEIEASRAPEMSRFDTSLPPETVFAPTTIQVPEKTVSDERAKAVPEVKGPQTIQ